MADAFLKAATDIIGARLKAEGFRQHRGTWNRARVGMIQVVELQRSQYNVTEQSRFTVNLGVAFAALAPKGAIVKPPHDEGARERIGVLTPAKQDTWYDYRADDPDSMAGALNRAADDIMNFGLAWLAGQTRRSAAMAPSAVLTAWIIRIFFRTSAAARTLRGSKKRK